jgi:hypothetical protein
MYLAVGSTNNNVVFVSVKLLTVDEPHILRNASNDRAWSAYTVLAITDDSVHVICEVSTAGVDCVGIIIAEPDTGAVTTRDADARAWPGSDMAPSISQRPEIAGLAFFL